MLEILRICAILELLIATAILLRAYSVVRRTTLRSACCWSFVAVIAWLVALVVGHPRWSVPVFFRDLCWYEAAILSLCPAVSVLGARRPVADVWSLFVVIPLIGVLSLPAMMSSWGVGHLYLETPILAGFCCVAVMGLGNYLGTRQTFSVLLLGIAVLLVMLSFSYPFAAAGDESVIEQRRLWAAICFPAAIFTASFFARQRRQTSAITSTMKTATAKTEEAEYDFTNIPQNRLWLEFFHWYGLVWSKRILERVNRTAEEEQWPTRLELTGLYAEPSAKIDRETGEQITKHFEKTLRWLFKRFVETDWIDEQLKSSK